MGGGTASTGSSRRTPRLLALCLLAGVVAPAAGGASAVAGEPFEPRSLTVVEVGDIIPHDRITALAQRQAGGSSYDYRPMFADVEPVISAADLAICHLEGPVAPAGVRISGGPTVAMPAEVVASLRDVGFDRCALANNHIHDLGRSGINATVTAFRSAGLGFSGIAVAEEERSAPIESVNGVKVAHLSYTYGLPSTWRYRALAPWSVNRLLLDSVLSDAADARERGAEVVLVTVHWGRQYRSRPEAWQREFARKVSESGLVDLLVGSHPHVAQPIEKIGNLWVVYSLGNFLTDNRPGTGKVAATQDGMILRVRISEQEGGGFAVERPEVIPTFVSVPTYRVLDVAKHVSDPSLSRAQRSALSRSLRRTSTVVGGYFLPA